MALLEVSGLTASYGALTVLRDVAFKIEEGGITALLGANGAGKTTTLRAICGMVRRSGTITFDGASIAQLTTDQIVRRGIAHVPEMRGTFTTLTTDENLRLGAMTRPNDASVAEDMAAAFEMFPRLKERRHQQAGTLSGGEQQMLAIARAMMMRPRLLLLDEPSFGLAPLITEQIFDILARIRAERGTSILLVEQNADLALELADQACLLETGRIVVSGPAADLRADEAIRASYLGY